MFLRTSGLVAAAVTQCLVVSPVLATGLHRGGGGHNRRQTTWSLKQDKAYRRVNERLSAITGPEVSTAVVTTEGPPPLDRFQKAMEVARRSNPKNICTNLLQSDRNISLGHVHADVHPGRTSAGTIRNLLALGLALPTPDDLREHLFALHTPPAPGIGNGIATPQSGRPPPLARSTPVPAPLSGGSSPSATPEMQIGSVPRTSPSKEFLIQELCVRHVYGAGEVLLATGGRSLPGGGSSAPRQPTSRSLAAQEPLSSGSEAMVAFENAFLFSQGMSVVPVDGVEALLPTKDLRALEVQDAADKGSRVQRAREAAQALLKDDVTFGVEFEV